MKNKFAFRIYPTKLLKGEKGSIINGSILITLDLTQEQFEDHQGLKDAIHAAAANTGYPDIYDWHDEPAYSPELLAQLREAIGCDVSAELCLYHPHSFRHRHYKQIELDGVIFRYMAFSDGRFIKVAQELVATEKA